jgi:TonB family protein
LAGLIKYSDNEQVTGVPFLSKIPIVGALFRNRNTPSPDTNTEMVIILTPRVLTEKKFANSEVVMPTPSERDSWDQIDAKYEHQALSAATVPMATNTINATATIPAVNMQQEDLSTTVFPTDELTAYARRVQEKISKAIAYPSQAKDGLALTGTVKLKLHILKDGSLDAEEVMQSSGNKVLDQNAMQAAKAAAPFDAFTMGMDQGGMIFTIPIVYNKLITQRHSPAAEKVTVSY